MKSQASSLNLTGSVPLSPRAPSGLKVFRGSPPAPKQLRRAGKHSPLNPKRYTLNASPKVFVGLSGGVDSSVSAALLKEQGFDVTGVFIKVWQPDWIECTWKEDRLDAMRVCAKLGIPFVTLDLEKEYKKEVVDYMIREYKSGRTPNPDVMCNKEVKFGAFYRWARKQGADYVATGHYARIVESRKSKVHKVKSGNKTPRLYRPYGPYGLLTALDFNKDQSYFLWNLKQEQLGHVLFPIGHLEKPEVRKLAQKFGLITADKKDSQGLCFIGKVDMKDFLKNFIQSKHGKVLDTARKVIGYHEGAVFYTIGERHGFTITKKTADDKPLYVVSKNGKANTITVSDEPLRLEGEYKKQTVSIEKTNWVSGIPKKGMKVHVRPRYRQELIQAKISNTSKGKATIGFNTLQYGLTSGQSLVIYYGETVVGGGVIQ